ncbi:MAG: SEC-C metal-binding domain-containing protein [Acidimicrobiia bacterium]
MCTPEVALMGMDRGILARIDRKLLAGLGQDEAYRTVRVPAIAAKWSTWKRYCDSVGVSMGRAVTVLIDRELISVFGERTAGEQPVFAPRATEELAIREAKIEAREREVDTDEARMREWSERLRRWEDELEAREQRAESVSKLASRHATARAKIGSNERCPCRSGLKYKHCHGLASRRTQPDMHAQDSAFLPLLNMGRQT